MTTAYLKINDADIYYEIAGEGDTLVMAHAGFVDSGMWDAQWDVFAGHFRVVRFDMQGYGKSSPATGPIARYEELAQVLDALDIQRAHLLGCSLSGTTILDFALQYPQRVQSLIAVSAAPGGFELQGPPPRYMFEMMEAAQSGDIERASELQVRIWFDGESREPQDTDQNIRQQVAAMNRIAVNNNTFFIAEAQPAILLDPPAITRLADIPVPTLVIVGALDHPEILRAADVLVDGIDGAQKVIIPDAAHVPNMEQPTIFNEAVLSFLKG
ncbi:MAG: alpha/beta hydrolase [Chloroflexi bacterium]|nr:alpha/beta hydrolase [Chloroflexota bacterium]